MTTTSDGPALRHVGYVVGDLRATLDDLRRLFDLADEDVVVVPPWDEDAETRFGFVTVHGVRMELIEPVSERFVAALQPGPRARIDHLCFTVADLDLAYDDLVARGAAPGHVTPDGPIDMPHQRMVYLDPETTGGFLLELVQPIDPAADRFTAAAEPAG